jgi:hypothetical protein
MLKNNTRIRLCNEIAILAFLREGEMCTIKAKTKLHCLSPPANYTDRATAACRRS